MSAELKLEIGEMPEETAKVILWLSSEWKCTAEEAAKRMLNEAAERLANMKPAA